MAFKMKKSSMIADTIEPTPPDAAQRACVTQYDTDGNMVVRTYGHSPSELQDLHNAHRCGASCTICYDEAMKTVCSKDPDTCSSIPPGSCSPDCHGFECKY